MTRQEDRLALYVSEVWLRRVIGREQDVVDQRNRIVQEHSLSLIFWRATCALFRAPFQGSPHDKLAISYCDDDGNNKGS